ncbi:hypothetical protein [Pseudoalteromonas sp. BDTF-M6]|uniref:tetratricopeptide repeat protein n=1 Tax=Pseudoalteromonas sp. BDTF-M6 TaxID=2796132 RepID=UPI001BAF33E7|nr:hypothetical protein [Pseudoalteromonas sp. BDTF-M6]MBS3796361.1 hypothetical protein [Pseudoalteromonas sp. BDTF-M6]
MSPFFGRALLLFLILFPHTAFANNKSDEGLVDFLGFSAWGVPKDKVDLPALSAKVAMIVTDDPETRQKVADHFAQWFSQYPGIVLEVNNAGEYEISFSALGKGTFGDFNGPVIVVEDRLGSEREPIGNFYLLELSQNKDDPRVADVVIAHDALTYSTWIAYDLYFTSNPSKALLQRFVSPAKVSDEDWAIFQSIWEHGAREEWKEVMAGFDMLSPSVRVSPLMLALKYKTLAQLGIDTRQEGLRNFALQQRHYASTAKTVEQVYGESIYTALRLLPWYWDENDYQKMSKALSIVESNFGLTEEIIRHLIKSYRESGDYQSALRYAKMQHENTPTERTYSDLINILISSKNYEQALVYAKMQHAYKPTEKTYSALVKILIDTKGYEQALAYSEQYYNKYKDQQSAFLVTQVHSLLGNKKQVRQFRQLLLDEYDMHPLHIDMILTLINKNFKALVKLLDENKDQIPVTPSDLEKGLIFEDFLKSKEYKKWAEKFD